MKKWIKVAGSTLLLCLVVVLTVPFFMGHEAFRESVIQQLSERSGAEVKVEEVGWHWLPLPHILMENGSLLHDRADVTFPSLAVYPHWTIILGTRGKIGTISLSEPRIHLIGVPTRGSGKAAGAIPRMDIEIENGTVIVDTDEDMKKVFPADSIEFSSLNGEIDLGHSTVGVEVEGSASFVEHFQMQGGISLSDQSYRLRFDFRGYDIAELLRPRFGERLKATRGEKGSLSGNVEGTGFETDKADIRSTLPPFSFAAEGREVLFGESTIDLNFRQTEEGMEIVVRGAELSLPQVAIEGTVRRTSTPGDGSAEPNWEIDLRGTDVDLTQVREKVLALWGNLEVVRETCNIVRGGTATTFRYRFSGPEKDLEDIETLDLETEVRDATVHIPEVDMKLEEAAGPIRIKEGILSGERLASTYAGSQARNGRLVVDLRTGADAFEVEMDLDADLTGLLPLLGKVVRSDPFLGEIKRFRDVRGTASGHLVLKYTPQGLVTDLKIGSGNIHTGYDRIPWPVDLKSGSLTVSPGSVHWKDVRAVVGPHTLRDAAGSATWENDDVELRFDRLNASCDAEEMHRFLVKNGVIPEYFSEIATSIEGMLDISDFALTGPAEDPSLWKFTANVAARDLSWSSTKLPGPVIAEKAGLILTDSSAKITAGRFSVLGKPLDITGDFVHKGFTGWQGSVRFNGTVQKDLVDWVEQHDWFPEAFTPYAPVKLVDFGVTINDKSTGIKGQLVGTASGASPPRFNLDIVVKDRYFNIRNVSVKHGEEEAKLSCEIDRHPSSSAVRCTGSGMVTMATIDDFLVPEIPVSGTFQGDFDFALGQDVAGRRFAGHVAGTDVRWGWGTDPVQEVDMQFRLQGKDESVDVETLELVVDGETIQGSGSFTPSLEGVLVDLAFSSSEFSWDSVKGFMAGLTAKGAVAPDGGSTEHREEEPHEAPWDVTGTVGFAVDRFMVDLELPEKEGEDVPQLTLESIHGKTHLLGDGSSSVQVESARLCEIALTATAESTDGDTTTVLRLVTDKENPPRFEHSLQCLGLTESFGEGPYDFEAILERKEDKWSRGRVRLRAREGRIHKAKTLSKALDTVDETEVLTDEEEEGFRQEGMRYKTIDFSGDIKDNVLTARKAAIVGETMDIFARGTLDLGTLEANATLLIAPLRTVDTVVTKIPLFGQALGGENNAIITIAVGITGDIRNPKTSIVPPSAIGAGLLNIAKDTLLAPVRFFSFGAKKEDDKPLELPGEGNGSK